MPQQQYPQASYSSYGMGYQRTPQPFDGIISVSGLDGANAYQMPPNSRAALFDKNEDVVYIKTTDGAGFPTMVPYNLTLATMASKADDTVTRKDLESIEQKIDRIEEMLTSGQQYIPQPAAQQTGRTAKSAVSRTDDGRNPQLRQGTEG